MLATINSEDAEATARGVKKNRSRVVLDPLPDRGGSSAGTGGLPSAMGRISVPVHSVATRALSRDEAAALARILGNEDEVLGEYRESSNESDGTPGEEDRDAEASDPVLLQIEDEDRRIRRVREERRARETFRSRFSDLTLAAGQETGRRGSSARQGYSSARAWLGPTAPSTTRQAGSYSARASARYTPRRFTSFRQVYHGAYRNRTTGVRGRPYFAQRRPMARQVYRPTRLHYRRLSRRY